MLVETTAFYGAFF